MLDVMNVTYETDRCIRSFWPDILIGDLIIEVQGCYWHCCDVCYRERGLSSEQLEWKSQKRDEKRWCAFDEMGYTVRYIWEHEMNDLRRVLEVILDERA